MYIPYHTRVIRDNTRIFQEISQVFFFQMFFFDKGGSVKRQATCLPTMEMFFDQVFSPKLPFSLCVYPLVLGEHGLGNLSLDVWYHITGVMR